jgi:hypothetical protein
VPIIHLLVLVLTIGMIGITLVIGVSVILGIGWLAVSVPVLVVIAVVAVGRTLWRRWARSLGAPEE